MDSSLPMIGSLTGTVSRIQTVSIHGDVYYDVAFQLKPAPARPVAVRIPSHLCTRPPQPGERLELSFLMHQVHGVKFPT